MNSEVGPLAEIEARATLLRVFELAVPGLLQTEDYARAVLRTWPGISAERVEELVAARMQRQAILDSDEPPTLVVLLDEPILTRTVGGLEVMRVQLEALADAAQRPKVVVQVAPLSSGAVAGLGGMFIVASLADTGGDVLYFETILRGHVTDGVEEVAGSITAFEAARTEALSPEASLDLIRKHAEHYELAQGLP